MSLATPEDDQLLASPNMIQLAEILQRNRGTEYGLAHFAHARTAEEYQRAPLLTPAALQPWVKREMEGAYKLKVPLLVDVGVGDNWRDAK